ncbi:helix-turn-helix domain-containing protein [Mesorhizobium sp. BR1-1-6]|uniref:helix-turn-helix domain-containing protein n=1 Tax=Mesorhizobium sp. BR1-1-6 TaxID=2876648 RepID=UPI001CD06870|nr:helix-turn-helix domain-containing protein [Mesorhizobium sp. BR1-1-6]MBZ9894243.1 helix-turn-helix domain-containing protein [Mesorhizobium sp. BR1-1-6]
MQFSANVKLQRVHHGAKMTLQEDKLGYSPEEAAAVMGSGRTNIFRAIKNGSLKARKFGRRTVILRDDLKAFLETLPEKKVA